MPTILALAMTLSAPEARAAWPNDIDLEGMTEHDGAAVVTPLQEDYFELLRELATAISTKPAMPAKTLGAYGFETTLSTTLVPITTEGDDGPGPWRRAHIDEDPAAVMAIPSLNMRKGLPFSTEVGAGLGWLGGSRQARIGAFGRIGLIEGYRPAPDLSLRVGYTAYVGNDQLEVGVVDVGLCIGTTVPLGPKGMRNGRFSPWFDYTTMRVNAAPVIDDDTADQIGALPVSASQKTAQFQPAMIVPQLGGGLDIQRGNGLYRLTFTWAPTTIATVSLATGLAW